MIDVLVLGAGAAGLFCASVAASRGLKVVVLEHNSKSGKKIRISGGGRCNFTNHEVSHKNFLSNNPNFARSALVRYQPKNFIQLVESYGIAWHEKTLGQLFCDNSAQQIIDMLEAECNKHEVQIQHSVAVLSVTKTDVYSVNTTSGTLECRNVVVATGGLSIPPLGATNAGYLIAEHFNLNIIKPEPALVPLLCSKAFMKQFGELAGQSFLTRVTVGNISFLENVLITHRGLSGPAILQASLYLVTNQSITMDILPAYTIDELYEKVSLSKKTVRSVLNEYLPSRLISALNVNTIDKPCNAVGKKAFFEIIENFKSWVVQPVGNEGFEKAEVTRGGVSTDELSSKTLECREVSGLYFIGEVVDVTGWLGGYNFQWAWSSAIAAGLSVT
ncbi:MAG: NAD(P)/FAD-dependent oxidoreductase [Ignavibacteria bacterium]|nr:NAD(P)/FAD-dependent oxidoreductase [Ignavibacteria bacterium]